MDDLTPASVKGLTEAWVAHTGEYAGGMGPNPPQSVEGFQTRPTLVGGLLIVTTTTSKVIALDAETGKEAWRFDPFTGKHVCDFPHRGVAVWSAASESTIFSGTCDGHLIALDARTGQPRSPLEPGARWTCAPAWGSVRLRDTASRRLPRSFGISSSLAAGARKERAADHPATSAPSTCARARSAGGSTRSRSRASPDTRPGPSDAWQGRTGVNVWSTMSVDDERGLLFLPIGSASYDFYGADRPGRTSSRTRSSRSTRRPGAKWHFQLVHHDLWDYDSAGAADPRGHHRNGSRDPAVIQLTKMGLSSSSTA